MLPSTFGSLSQKEKALVIAFIDKYLEEEAKADKKLKKQTKTPSKRGRRR